MARWLKKMGILSAICFFAIFLSAVVSTSRTSLAVSATAFVKQIVISALSIIKTSDLIFTEAPQGDGAKTVPAGKEENPQNASFRVSGEKNKAFQIVLPEDGTVFMKYSSGEGNADEKVEIVQFRSFPESSGALNASGEQTIYVGATRLSLKPDQPVGSYEGSFSVSVVY